MAESLTTEQIEAVLRDRKKPIVNGFDILRSLSNLRHRTNEVKIQELFLRILERRGEFSSVEPIVNSLAKELGLFPYMENHELFSLQESLQYEYHRPKGLSDEIVFHQIQAKVYFELLSGKNIILSAPTSFGKSLIIDAIIASNAYQNIAIIVPTIALIDETRRRLSKFSGQYKLITHGSQETDVKNVFILTQERAIEFLDTQLIDFFVVDEFYKIQPNGEDDGRSYLLNQIFYRLLKAGAQFYLLGPNIENVDISVFPNPENVKFVRTDFQTVVSEIHRVKVEGNDDNGALIRLCKTLDEPTLIYCKSPASAHKVARALLSSGAFANLPENADAVNWFRKEYHPDWLYAEAYSKGIGIHHAKIPRALSQLSIRKFNQGLLRFLICTTTLIEGVNTKAKNVIIFDNKIGKDKFDFFTFNNIKGRSGRMFQYFIGRVYLFNDPPPLELPLIDFPILSQPADAPASMLLQVDVEDLSDFSKAKIADLMNQATISIEVLKANQGIDIDAQIRLAEEIARKPKFYSSKFRWHSYPNYDQLSDVCNIVWEFFEPRRGYGANSSSQLLFKLWKFQMVKDIGVFVKELVIEDDYGTIDEKVDETLDFLKQWVNFQMPRYLMAISRIQKEVLDKARLPSGDFSYYSRQMESYFTDSALVALDEYGIPLQVSKKLTRLLQPEGKLDPVLERLRMLNQNEAGLSPFEWSFIEETKSNL